MGRSIEGVFEDITRKVELMIYQSEEGEWSMIC